MDPGGLKFWAFISYSHRDGKVASAVQRALESYRLPSRLVGRPTPFGPAPRSLKPVFRDREELQASADLDATVREALAQSRNLVVLCSPDAARSAWVNREIVEFKKLHGDSRVLALIVDGEPFASRMAGREAEECFPEALRFSLAPEGESRGPALEPMAADLRPGGDGMKLAMLKLVAGMLAGPYNQDKNAMYQLARNAAMYRMADTMRPAEDKLREQVLKASIQAEMLFGAKMPEYVAKKKQAALEDAQRRLQILPNQKRRELEQKLRQANMSIDQYLAMEADTAGKSAEEEYRSKMQELMIGRFDPTEGSVGF